MQASLLFTHDFLAATYFTVAARVNLISAVAHMQYFYYFYKQPVVIAVHHCVKFMPVFLSAQTEKPVIYMLRIM